MAYLNISVNCVDSWLKRNHVPPFVIFSDQALQDMCVILPTNEMEFLEVKGVGHSKLEKYGTIFLDAIKEYQSASQPG